MSPQRPSRARHLPAQLLALCGGLSAIPCAAQPVPTFTDVGPIPGAQASYLRGVSSDGNVAVGNIQSFGSQSVARWTRQTGLEDYGWPGYAFATSSNGSVMVGAAPGGRAFRLANGQYSELPAPPGGSDLAARSVSDDGAVVAGNLWIDGVPRAFRWTAAAGLVPLPVQAGVAERFAYVYQSGNGEFIVGTASAGPPPGGPSTAFRYTNGQYLQLLPLAGYQASYAWGVDNSGYVVVGTSYNQTVGREVPVRWRLIPGGGGPAPEPLGTFPGADYTFALDVSDDGDVVVGNSNYPDHSTATIWNSAGPRDLNALLASMSVSTNGLYLARATAVSGDGSVIVGFSGSDGPNSLPQRGWVIDFRRDSDGDGLLDHWEINGIPYINDNGQARRLHLPGADPAHKDLYVEVDSMAGITMQQAAVDMVVAAFNNAPLANPDGTTGVRLHVLMDETDLPHIAAWQTDGCWPLTYTATYEARFGTAAERQQNGGTGDAFRSAKALAYRYTIAADRAQPAVGGCAGAPSDKSVVFFGTAPTAKTQAAIFMHEFGHMLGLDHGGGDQVNGKPNYPSIMNYVLCYPFAWSGEFWRLDYSRAGGLTLGHLNESSLDENRGIGSAGGEYFDFIMPFGVSTPQGGRQIAYVSLDGAPVDYGNPAGTMVPDGNFDSSVAQDLNYLPAPPPGVNLPAAASPGQALQAHNDWAVVILPTPKAIGAAAPAPVYPTDELSTAARDWIEQNFPIPGGPAPCYANCDGSTGSALLTANDFQCFLNKYAALDPYANCDGSAGTPLLTPNDFLCFLNAYATGCP